MNKINQILVVVTLLASACASPNAVRSVRQEYASERQITFTQGNGAFERRTASQQGSVSPVFVAGSVHLQAREARSILVHETAFRFADLDATDTVAVTDLQVVQTIPGALTVVSESANEIVAEGDLKFALQFRLRWPDGNMSAPQSVELPDTHARVTVTHNDVNFALESAGDISWLGLLRVGPFELRAAMTELSDMPAALGANSGGI